MGWDRFSEIKIFLPNIIFNEIEIFTKTADFFLDFLQNRSQPHRLVLKQTEIIEDVIL